MLNGEKRGTGRKEEDTDALGGSASSVKMQLRPSFLKSTPIAPFFLRPPAASGFGPLLIEPVFSIRSRIISLLCLFNDDFFLSEHRSSRKVEIVNLTAPQIWSHKISEGGTIQFFVRQIRLLI